MTHTPLVLGIAVTVLGGCIGGGERTRATPDATTTDTTLAPDVTTQPPDVTTQTRDDVASDADAVDPESCDDAGDCGAPPECAEWDCVDRRCVSAPRAGPCDDANACTGTGTCADGVCQPGPSLECDLYTICGRPACDPEVGCVDELVDGGFCLADTAPSKDSTWGACNGIRMAPPDTCTSGGCVEQTTTNSVPLPKDRIVGDWFMVIQSALAINGVGTVAGHTTFDPDGIWTGRDFLATDGPLDVTTLGTRTWCIDSEGGLAMDIAINHAVGQVDPAGEGFALAGTLGNEVIVGLRPTGTVAAVDGAYAVVLSTADQDGELGVWSGTLTFDDGCLDEGAVFAGGGPEPVFVEATEPCFALPENALTSLQLQVTDLSSETVVPWTFSGALGPRSDTILMTRLAGDNTLAGGMLLAIRLSDAPAEAFEQRTQWALALQEVEPRDRGTTYRGFAGLLTFDDTRLSQGVLGRNTQVLGEQVVLDEYGRFVIALRTPEQDRNLSGYLAPSAGLGYFYEVDAPPGWTRTFDVPEAPAWPSLGIIVRRGHGQ